jgi:RHS repeat-associated protein
MAATATPCATVSGIHCLQYGGYGAWGNRLITDRSGDVGVFANEPPGFDSGTNRILGTGFGYDTRGNLNAQSDNTGMAYDGEGRQMAYCQNTQPCTRQGAVEQYFYDGEGRRVERVGTDGTTVYVYDAGGQLAAEYATAPPAASGMRYLTADHLGTTRAIADESGKLVECHDYYPFGEEVMFGASDPRAGLACYGTVAYGQPGFTGKERDKETDLDYFGARYLSGAQGRFTSADPLLNSGRPWDPQAWNRYAYGLNNPLKFVDPSGLYELDNTCGDGDKKCNKNFARYAKQLRSSLAKLSKKLEKASLAPDERGRLTSALATLGQEGVHNGVYVEFNSLSGTAAAQTNAFEDQQGGISHEITFDPAGEKGNSGDMWAVNAAHEGTHVEDERDPRYNAGGLSDFSTEYRGYMTSSAAAHALGFPSLFVNTGDGSKAEIWNVSWLSADRHTLTSTGQSARDNSITRHVEDKTHPVTVPHDPWGPR